MAVPGTRAGKAGRRTRKSAVLRPDKDKERVFKGLSTVLGHYGLKVRREELKRGPGWAATSGACRKEEESLVFVDRRMTVDDQIAFLIQTLIQSGIEVQKDALTDVSSEVQSTITSLLGIKEEGFVNERLPLSAVEESLSDTR